MDTFFDKVRQEIPHAAKGARGTDRAVTDSPNIDRSRNMKTQELKWNGATLHIDYAKAKLTRDYDMC